MILKEEKPDEFERPRNDILTRRSNHSSLDRTIRHSRAPNSPPPPLHFCFPLLKSHFRPVDFKLSRLAPIPKKEKRNRRADRYPISNLSTQTSNLPPNSFPNILQGSSNKDVPVQIYLREEANLSKRTKKLREREKRERFYFFHELLKSTRRRKREGEEGRCHVLNRDAEGPFFSLIKERQCRTRGDRHLSRACSG